MSSLIRGLTEYISSGNNKYFQITEFITCNTTHVVYVLVCPCNLMYVGRTKRTLKKRISEHLYNISIGFKYHSVSLHFKNHHNQDPSGLKFWGIDCIHPNWRVSNLVREISKHETCWIYLMIGSKWYEYRIGCQLFHKRLLKCVCHIFLQVVLHFVASTFSVVFFGASFGPIMW